MGSAAPAGKVGHDSLAAGVVVTNAILLEDPGDVGTFFDHCVSSTQHRSPERALYFAVLVDTIQLLFKTKPHQQKRRDFREALQWLLSDAIHWPFDYVNVCDALAINSTDLRRRVLQLLDTAEAEGRAVNLFVRHRRVGQIPSTMRVGSISHFYERGSKTTITET